MQRPTQRREKPTYIVCLRAFDCGLSTYGVYCSRGFSWLRTGNWWRSRHTRAMRMRLLFRTRVARVPSDDAVSCGDTLYSTILLADSDGARRVWKWKHCQIDLNVYTRIVRARLRKVLRVWSRSHNTILLYLWVARAGNVCLSARGSAMPILYGPDANRRDRRHGNWRCNAAAMIWHSRKADGGAVHRLCALERSESIFFVVICNILHLIACLWTFFFKIITIIRDI